MRGATVIAPGAKASASGKSQVMKMSTTSTAVEPAAGPRPLQKLSPRTSTISEHQGWCAQMLAVCRQGRRFRSVFDGLCNPRAALGRSGSVPPLPVYAIDRPHRIDLSNAPSGSLPSAPRNAMQSSVRHSLRVSRATRLGGPKDGRTQKPPGGRRRS